MTVGTPRRTLGELFHFKNGRGFKKTEWGTNGLPIIRIQNLNDEKAEFNYYKGSYEKDILVQKGDLLFSWSGTVGSSFGPHIWSRQDGLLNQHIFKIGFKTDIDSRYAYFALEFITEEIERSVNGSVGLVHITKEKLNQFTIPVPGMMKQQRIVSILDEAFEGIATAKANAEKNLQNAREVFKSHLQSALTQKRSGWKEKSLDSIATFSSGGTPSKQNASYWNGPIPWVSGRDMKTDRIGDTVLHISRAAVEASATRIAPIGSLLILVRGMGLANGVAIAELVAPCAFNQDIKGIRANPGIDPRFLLFSLRTKLSESDQILSNAAHGTLKIDMEVLQSITLLIPSLEIQREAVKQIDEIQEETKHLESIYREKLSSLDELKQSLLNRAFNGDL